MNVDRRGFIGSLGGAAAVAAMSHEARAEALEHYLGPPARRRRCRRRR